MTLGFNWSTNTNYSTGPDAGTPTKVDPSSGSNGFVRGVIAAAQHVNYLFNLVAGQLAKAIDGDGGGTYAPTNPIVIGGDGVTIPDEGLLSIDPGGVLDVDGELVVGSGGSASLSAGASLSLAAGATATISGTVNVAAGGIINLPGNAAPAIDGTFEAFIRMQDPDAYRYNDTDFVLSVPLVAMHAGAGWTSESDGGWNMTSADGTTALFKLDVQPGNIVNQLVMRIEGGTGAGHGGTPPGDRPAIALCIKRSDGSFEVIEEAVDDELTGAAYDASHEVTLPMAGDLPYTLGDGVLYVRVRQEGPTGGVPGSTQLHSITAYGTLRYAMAGPNGSMVG